VQSRVEIPGFQERIYERQDGAVSHEFMDYLYIRAALQYKPAALGINGVSVIMTPLRNNSLRCGVTYCICSDQCCHS